MAVTYGTIEQVDQQTIRLNWESDKTAPITYRVYREGRQIATLDSLGQEASYEFQVSPGEHPFVEILDDANAVPSIAFPGRMTLNWLSVSGAAYYRIDEYVSAVWTERAKVTEDGSGAYIWETRWLEDETNHQFRIVPVGTDGNAASSPLVRSAVMVRHPDAPTFSVTYSTSNIRIAVTA